MLKFYSGFEINDHTGSALTDYEMTEMHYERITSLQRAAFKHYKNDLTDFAMMNVANVDNREALSKYFKKLRLDINCQILISVLLPTHPQKTTFDFLLCYVLFVNMLNRLENDTTFIS